MFHLAESLATHAPQARGREREASSEMHGVWGIRDLCRSNILKKIMIKNITV